MYLLMNIIDFSSTLFGVGYNYRILNDHTLFPTKFNVNAKATLGARKSEEIKTNQSQLIFLANYLWSFNFRNHLFIQNETSSF